MLPGETLHEDVLPALGAAMRAAEEAWVKAGFPGDIAEIDALADSAARK